MIERQEYMKHSASKATLTLENNDDFGPVIAQMDEFLTKVIG
jgi:hypothetical protein